MEHTGLRRLIIAGGVGANRRLRGAVRALVEEIGCEVYYPRIEFCTDNAAMVAYAGCQRLLGGESEGLSFKTRARWPLEEMKPL